MIGFKPALAFAKIKKILAKIPKRKGNTAKSQATNGLAEMDKKWSQMNEDTQKDLAESVKEVSEHLDPFVNAGKSPALAVASAIAIISSFAVLMGPVGGIAGVALGFISGILGLFGEGEEQQSMDQIIRQELERLYEKQLTNQARGVLSEFKVSKAYLDGLDVYGISLTPSDLQNLACHIPVYQGLSFMGTLATEINTCVNRNQKKESGKCLKYLELYSNMAVFKDLILQQLIVHLQVDSLRNTRRGILSAQNQIRTAAKELYSFLYKVDIHNPQRGSQIVARFDPDLYKSIDLYSLGVLKIENYNRKLAGKFYINHLTIGNLSWSMDRKVPKYFWQYGEPQVLGNAKRGSLGGNLWKLVPHPGNLYSVFSQKYCPRGRSCNKMLSLDSNYPMVNLRGDHPMMWRITVNNDTMLRYIHTF